MKMRSKFGTKVLAAFAAIILVVAALAAATWKVSRDAAEAVQRVSHTHEVLDSIARTKDETLRI